MNSISRHKYPRTYHLPYSQTITDDDKRLLSDDMFIGEEVVVTEKMDGENSTVYQDGYVHARSIDGNKHPWQDWLKRNVQSWCWQIPNGWRVCGENLYPRHSIAYKFPNEKSFFQVFGIYDENGKCLSWDDLCIFCDSLELIHVPLIWRGVYESKDKLLCVFDEYKAAMKNTFGNEVEGFVMRVAREFNAS